MAAAVAAVAVVEKLGSLVVAGREPVVSASTIGLDAALLAVAEFGAFDVVGAFAVTHAAAAVEAVVAAVRRVPVRAESPGAAAANCPLAGSLLQLSALPWLLEVGHDCQASEPATRMLSVFCI